jgi:predicted type IV restriction endonuclease
MDFKDQIKQLSERILKLKDNIQTEEATKNAFIMPFIQALGYDVFNPLEILPEYTCDIGIKKGEKIDYAVLKDEQPIILIECKHCDQNLSLHDGQLLRYFHVSKAKFGILTNGINYRFYTDLVDANKMDEKPFFEIDMLNLKDTQIEELKKFHKSYFDISKIVGTANELKYTNEIKIILNRELKEPSEPFVRFFTSQVYNGRVTASILEFFTELVKKSAAVYMSDIITDKFKSALNQQDEENKSDVEKSVPVVEEEDKIVTTQEEMEAFYIVKAILRPNIDIDRVTFKDTQNWFNVLIDESIRKSVCKLYFNGKKKYIGILDENKKEVKSEIGNINDIFNHSQQLLDALEMYK